jgi:hypothetical protein
MWRLGNIYYSTIPVLNLQKMIFRFQHINLPHCLIFKESHLTQLYSIKDVKDTQQIIIIGIKLISLFLKHDSAFDFTVIMDKDIEISNGAMSLLCSSIVQLWLELLFILEYGVLN